MTKIIKEIKAQNKVLVEKYTVDDFNEAVEKVSAQAFDWEKKAEMDLSDTEKEALKTIAGYLYFLKKEKVSPEEFTEENKTELAGQTGKVLALSSEDRKELASKFDGVVKEILEEVAGL